MTERISGSQPASSSSNPNLLWAEIFVDELARGGLKAVCIAPGSRSTPLTLAFDAHPQIQIIRHLDERSAAFFALGMALASDLPVAMVCTSGTAAANFHPAIIEAYQSRVPLLVLTADRPPELRHSGANQTIDQVKMYGDHVLWAVDMALPQADAPPVAIRNLRTLAGRALATANGPPKGPVHLNFPFRKPLEPAGEALTTWQQKGSDHSASNTHDELPFTRFTRGVLVPTEAQVRALQDIIERYEHGLIVCGPRCPDGAFPEAVSALSRISSYPLLADPLSGLRFGPHMDPMGSQEKPPIIGGYDTFLAGDVPGWETLEVVIRFGDVPTSKVLNTYLDNVNPAHRFHLSHHGVWADDSHRVSDFYHVDPTSICLELCKQLEPRVSSGWMARAKAIEASCWGAMVEMLAADPFDGAVVADVSANLLPKALLFVGNSLPVRHVDQFCRPSVKPVRVFANRGASGIDGNISTALGIGAAVDGSIVALLGDITFYHDLNGLLAVKNLGLKVTIVLLNNNGGGIFRRLPIAKVEPPFTELFVTPHGLDFEPVARMYGLDFVRVDDLTSFQKVFSSSLGDSVPRVIEVRTDSSRDYARRQEVMAYVNRSISTKFTNEGASLK